MRYSRQHKILELINTYEIGTQDDLVTILRNNGYNVTQATVSRDIKELQLVKVLSSKVSINTYPTSQKISRLPTGFPRFSGRP